MICALPLVISLLWQVEDWCGPRLGVSSEIPQLSDFVMKVIDRAAVPPTTPAPSIDSPEPPDPSTNPPAPPDPRIKQKANLYEEKAGAAGTRGFVVWRSAWVVPRPGQSPDITIRADIEIPSERIRVRPLARNDDKSVPASHILSITFTVPKNSHGAIARIPGVLTQQGETGTGVPLAGRPLKVDYNGFLIYLSASDTDLKRNLQLLNQSWFVIPFIYADGGRAVIIVEKGPTGERVIADALGTWRADVPRLR